MPEIVNSSNRKSQYRKPDTDLRRQLMLTRKAAIDQIKRKLLSNSNPRFEMICILALTGVFGFISSFLMLLLGVTAMSIRYPIAVLFGYCMFLFILGVWIEHKTGRKIEPPDIDVDPLDIGLYFPHSNSGSSTFEMGGGSNSGGSTTGGGFSLDLDDAWLIILACAALAGALIVFIYVIYSAPVFLAEILLDSLLLAGLNKKLKNTEDRHWVMSAVRRSWIQVGLVIAFFAIAGYLMQMAAPEAHSMGEVWAHFKAD
jgi:hypothetical protein